jgi:hypothetical protein
MIELAPQSQYPALFHLRVVMLQLQELFLESTNFVEVNVPVVPQVKQDPLASRMTPFAMLQVEHFPDVEFEVQRYVLVQTQPPLPSPFAAELMS